MLLLALIGLAQLAVLVMLLAVIAGQASQHETEQQLAGERIRGIQHQTIEALFTAVDSVVIDRAGRRVYPGR